MAEALDGLAPGTSGAAVPAVLKELARQFAAASGSTPDRFASLAAVCAHDVVLGKLFESHLDALEILREVLGAQTAAALAARLCATDDGLWGVWAAEGPGRLAAQAASPGATSVVSPFLVTGRKSWCSGARGAVAAALVTARETMADGAQVSRLFAVSLSHPGVTVTDEGWDAVGMRGTGSVDVVFDGVPAWPVGAAGDYVGRPGFWHGAAGIAACWHGAACAIAAPLRTRVRHEQERAVTDGHEADGLLAAHLGAVDCALSASATMLRAAALHIDQDRATVAGPGGTHRATGPAFGRREALAVRASTETAAQAVMDHVGRALGAGPLCRDARHAARVADLSVFLRQSHAEWDLAVLGRLAATAACEHERDDPWML